MQKILGKISQWLADENVIEQKDKGLYEYALKSVLITICPFIAALVIGSLMGMIKEAVLLIIPFMIIQQIQRVITQRILIVLMDMLDSIMWTYSWIYIFVPIYR